MSSYALFFRGDQIKLEPRVFDVLHLLLQRPNELITKDEFLEFAWRDKVVSDWALSRAIKVLRRVLQQHNDNDPIKTLYGKGYLFALDVTSLTEEEFLLINRSYISQKATAERQIELASKSPSKTLIQFSQFRTMIPIVVFLVAIVTLAFYFLPEADIEEAESVVVLPIINLNDDPSLSYLSNGLTDIITGYLAKTQNLRVISNTSAKYYSNKKVTPSEIAQELNVDSIVEGSIYYDENKVHLNLRLINAKSEVLVWSFERTEALSDIYSFFQETAIEVAKRVTTKQSNPLLINGKVTQKSRPQSFETYLKARYLLNQRLAQDLEEATRLLDQVILTDSTFADAYATLASVYIVMSTYSVDRTIDRFLLAKKNADKAILLDPNSSLAWTNRGLIEFGHDYNFQQAALSFEKAISINNNNVDAKRAYAELLAVTSKYRQALSLLEESWQQDMMNPLLIAIWGSVLMMDGQYDKALEKFELAKSLGSRMIWVDRDLAYLYQWKGDVKTSLAYRYQQMDALGYFEQGDDEFKRKIRENGLLGFWQWRLPILKLRWEQNKLHACNLSEAYAGVGDYKEMLRWFNQGLEQKSENCFQIVKRSPEFVRFKEELEFKTLLSRYSIFL